LPRISAHWNVSYSSAPASLIRNRRFCLNDQYSGKRSALLGLLSEVPDVAMEVPDPVDLDPMDHVLGGHDRALAALARRGERERANIKCAVAGGDNFGCYQV